MRLRVMCFNIRQKTAMDGPNRWYKRRGLVFDVIRRCAPDVIGAQEVHPTQLDELLDALDGFGAIAHRRYGGIVGAYAPILFDTRRLEAAQSGDFWLAPDPDGRKTRAWDAAVARVCTWAVFRDRDDGSRFAIMNSHFDQRGTVARVESARLVVERLTRLEHLPRLFTCDLNANEQSEPLAILEQAGMHDTFRDVRPTEEPSFTYHRFRGSRSRGVLGKIDHILRDDRWATDGAEIVRDEFEGRLPSDHYPLVADVRLEDG